MRIGSIVGVGTSEKWRGIYASHNGDLEFMVPALRGIARETFAGDLESMILESMIKVIVDQYSHGWVELGQYPTETKAVIPGDEMALSLRIVPGIGHIAAAKRGDRVTQKDVPGPERDWLAWVYLVDPADGVIRIYEPNNETGELELLAEEKVVSAAARGRTRGRSGRTAAVNYPVDEDTVLDRAYSLAECFGPSNFFVHRQGKKIRLERRRQPPARVPPMQQRERRRRTA